MQLEQFVEPKNEEMKIYRAVPLLISKYNLYFKYSGQVIALIPARFVLPESWYGQERHHYQ